MQIKKMRTQIVKTVLIFAAIAFLTINFGQNGNLGEISSHDDAIFRSPESADSISNIHVTLYKNGVKLGGADVPQVRRALDTINITYYDAPGYWPTCTFKANITLNDGTQFNLTLNQIAGSSMNFSTVFTPAITNATGVAKITILALIGTAIQNPNPIDVDRTIDIKNNLPICGVAMNSTSLYRNQKLLLNLTPSDIEDSVSKLTWNVTLYNPSVVFPSTAYNSTLIATSNLIFNYSLDITKTFALGTWTIKATCKDSSSGFSGVQSKYYYFTVLNNLPLIDTVQFKVNGIIKSGSPISLLRVTELLVVNVNATDVENVKNLIMRLEATDPKTGQNILLPSSSFLEIAPIDNNKGVFSKNFTIPSWVSCGIISLKIIIKEGSGTTSNQDETTQLISIKNNVPQIMEFKINDESGKRFSFVKDDTLTFSASIYDADNSIQYIKIVMDYEDGVTYLNFSTNWMGNSTFISVRAYDLPDGVYYISLYVMDENNDIAQSLPIAVNISIEEETDPIIWLLFGVGIIIGAILSFGIAFWRIRTSARGASANPIREEKESEISNKKKDAPKSAKDQPKGTKEVEKTKEKSAETKKETSDSKKSDENTTVSKTPSGSQKKLIRKL